MLKCLKCGGPRKWGQAYYCYDCQMKRRAIATPIEAPESLTHPLPHHERMHRGRRFKRRHGSEAP